MKVWVEYLKGGAVKQMDERYAKPLVGLKIVRYCGPADEAPPASAAQPNPIDDDHPKPAARRIYRRRDMTAEGT